MDNIELNKQWHEEEIKQLIEYTQFLQKENEDMKANVITMNAKLMNEESKVRQLNNLIKQMVYGTRN